MKNLFSPEDGFLLRPYQSACVEASVQAMDGGLDPMCVLATGTGKTPCLAVIGKRRAESTKTRTLFLVHRSELADQLESWLARVDPDHPPSREQGESEVLPGLWESRYVVAMVQSISQAKRLKRYDPKKYGTIITDEGHHAQADSYRKVHDHFLDGNRAIRRCGFSACWLDSGGKAIGRRCGYNHVAYQLRVREAIREGWLVRVRGVPVTNIVLDWGKLGSLEAIEDAMAQEEPIHKLVKAIMELGGSRQTLAFCTRKSQARAMSLIFNRKEYAPGSARYITDEQGRDPILRRNLAQDFRTGLFQRLVNCGVYTEGTDFPNVSCVAICRPCQSESLAAQIVGRGMRPLPGVLDDPRLWEDPEARLAAIQGSAKPDCLVLDFNLNVTGRKLLTVADVLGEEYSPQVRDYARQIPRDPDKPEDEIERLDRAEAEWSLIQEEIERRASIAARAVTYKTEEIDLFDPRVKAAAVAPTPTVGREPPTDKQVWVLVNRCGWSEAKARSLAKRQASAIITKWMRKQSETQVAQEQE